MAEPITFQTLPYAGNCVRASDDPDLRYTVYLQRAYGAEQHHVDQFPFDAEREWLVANAEGEWAIEGVVYSDNDDYAVEADGTFKFVSHKDAALFQLWFP